MILGCYIFFDCVTQSFDWEKNIVITDFSRVFIFIKKNYYAV